MCRISNRWDSVRVRATLQTTNNVSTWAMRVFQKKEKILKSKSIFCSSLLLASCYLPSISSGWLCHFLSIRRLLSGYSTVYHFWNGDAYTENWKSYYSHFTLVFSINFRLILPIQCQFYFVSDWKHGRCHSHKYKRPKYCVFRK